MTITVGLLALDLDGTALRYDGTISSSVVTALQQVVSAGVVVMPATVRMPASTRTIWERLALPSGPSICAWGGEVLEFPSEKRWWRNPLPDVAARYAVHAAINQNFLVRMFIGEDLWVSRDEQWLGRYASNRGIQIVVRHGTSLAEWPEPPVKIMISGPSESLENFDAEVMRSDWAGCLRLVQSHADSLEVWPSQVGKALALAKVSSRLAIPSSNIVAIGDGESDVDMLRWAGFGIAMGQSGPEVQAAADVVVPSVDQDGLIWAIERYILDKTID